MKIKFKTVLAIVLAVVIGVINPMQVFASTDIENYLQTADPLELEKKINESFSVSGSTVSQDKNPIIGTKLYISDIKIVNGYQEDGAKEAVDELHNAGYIVFYDDLNYGTDYPVYYRANVMKHTGKYDAYNPTTHDDSNRYFSYIGYKLTTDPDKAIRDLRVMDEDGGFNVFAYKNFMEGQLPGLGDTANSMAETCKEFRTRFAAGSYAAKTAKEYLDLFCVPKTSAENEGELLGDYLLSPDRTADDFKQLRLALNTLMVNVIDTYLAIGITDSEIALTQANGGLKENGKVANVYTSRNGVTGYLSLTDNGDWLKTAALKTVADEKFDTIDSDKYVSYFSDKMKEFGAQIVIIRRAFNENTLSDTAVSYLKSEVLEESKGKLSLALGTDGGCTAYDLLTKGSDRILCLFLDALPEICDYHQFIDVLEVCAGDCLHRLPTRFTFNKQVKIDWVPDVIEAIDNEQLEPSDKLTYNSYKTDIKAFYDLFKAFIPEYEAAIKKYEENPNAPLFDETNNTLDKIEKKNAETLKNQEKPDSASYIYYVAIRDYFAGYTVYNGVGRERIPLIDYLINAIKGQDKLTDTVMARIYPVVKTLSVPKQYSYKTNGMFAFLTYSIMGTDELAGLEAARKSYDLMLTDSLESENHSIWIGGSKDLLEYDKDAGIAMTSQRVMDTINRQGYKQAFPDELSANEKYMNTLTKLGIAALCCIAAAVLAYIGVAISFAVAGVSALEGIALISALFLSWSGIIGSVFCLLTVLAVAAVVVIAMVMIVYLILLVVNGLKEYNKYWNPVHTKIPYVMFDCLENEHNVVTRLCRYEAVTDLYGKAADINANHALKWCALYYTKDKDVGSPLTCNKNGEFFTRMTGSFEGPEKSVSLSKFLSIISYNLNDHCYWDNCSGLYLFYYTEDSMNDITPPDKYGKKYIDSIKIGYSDNEEGVKSYVKMEEGYQLIGVNLSPNTNMYTYIAIHTTDDPNDAITDIRAAYCTDAKEIMYGDVKYHTILDEKMLKVPAITCDRKTQNRKDTKFYYGLYVTKSKKVGDPLLAKGFGSVSDLSQIPETAEVISYFGGMPLDFNQFDAQENYLVGNTDKNPENSTDENNKLPSKVSCFDVHRYVYFKSERAPDVDYKSKTYLAGMAFFAGSQDLYNSETTNPVENSLQRFAEGAFGAVTIGGNLSPGLYYNDEDETYLGYIWTHNPKRAITDIAVFTGEPKSTVLPQNILVAQSGYCVCDVYTQADGHFYGSYNGTRNMRKSHAYYTSLSDEYYGYYWPEKVAVLPRGLYACGPQEGVKPIELDNLVFSSTSDAPPTNTNLHGNANLHRFTTTGEGAALDGQLLGTDWHTVHAIDQYYFDKYDANGEILSRYNIAIGDNPEKIKSGTGSLYIYYKNGTGPRVRGNYISNVAFCGCSTENNAYNEARCQALSSGEDIVNLAEPMCLTGGVYRELANPRAMVYQSTIERTKKYNDNCYFVSATYTNDPLAAVGSMRILRQGMGKTPLPQFMKLPLYNTEARSNAFQKNSIAPNLGVANDILSDGTTNYSGYSSYISADGTPINRVEVRTVSISAGVQSSATPAGAENGAAEYYVQAEDTLEPFILKNGEEGTGAVICLQRCLEADGSNKNLYIMGLKVIESDSTDGNMIMPAAWLGAMGFPYIIDFDLAEGKESYGKNTVVALGVERTSDPRLALKDIRLSPDDLGEIYLYDNMRYERVNDKPIRIAGADKNGVYIYTTDGSDSRSVLWSEVDKENTDWLSFDWVHLNYTKSIARDKNCFNEIDKILSQYPALQDYVNMVTSDDYTAVDNAERARWARRTAITNIGYEPSMDCPEQIKRSAYGSTLKGIYWAGCTSYGMDKLPVVVTDATPVYTVGSFGEAGQETNLRFTNAGNMEFQLYESPADRVTTEQSASVFTGRNMVVLSVLSLIFLAGQAAAFIFYKKKIIGKKEKKS